MPYLITPAGCRCCHLQVYVAALEVKQPADDNCIYHSPSEGAKRGGVNFGTPGLLREACTDFFVKSSLCRLEGLGGHALREVASHHECMGVETYAKAMRSGKWGGALEIAICAHINNARVNVYVPTAGRRFKLLARYGSADAALVISVVYVGGVHYNLLVLEVRRENVIAINVDIKLSPIGVAGRRELDGDP